MDTKTGLATYSPEDNKLRLYVGRVPREEYLKLRAEGWVALHKQRETGGGDFAATWTPQRRDTALSYAESIEDEDRGPEERAADRAERFGGYRDKRADEAGAAADKYESGPTAHGYQSEARAERAAARHDRQGAGAVDLWSKAEYWQRRTAGVISHALYKSSPGVRMGRIKTLEADLRKVRSELEAYAARFAKWREVAAMTDAAKQLQVANILAGYEHGDFTHPHTGKEVSLYRIAETEGVTGAQVAEIWLKDRGEPATETDWTRHLTLRLAYENQMLEAQGGRAAFVEIIPGGWLGSHQIQKVNKSSVTGRVVSVAVKVATNGRDRWGNEDKNAPPFRLAQIDTERLSVDSYRPPTEEELAAFHAEKKEAKANAPKKEVCPLINPTEADAERLQAVWNERAKARLDKYDLARFKPSTVCRITQATYSANSKGSYARAETRGLHADAELSDRESNLYSRHEHERANRIGRAICQIRQTYGDGNFTNSAPRVIVLTDRPQKPIPAAVWKPVEAEKELVPA